MTKSEIIQRTAEYVIGLSDKTHLTMCDAVAAACPNENFDGIDFLDYCFLDEIIKTVEKTGIVLDYSSHDGKCEGVPFNLDFIVRKKRLQNARIVSNLLCYGPCPKPDDAIEQRFTISSSGAIYFTEYLFGKIGEDKHPLGRRVQYSIGKEKATEILSLLADYIETNSLICWAKDVGDWNLTVTYPNGDKKELRGSLVGGVTVGDAIAQYMFDIYSDNAEMTKLLKKFFANYPLVCFAKLTDRSAISTLNRLQTYYLEDGYRLYDYIENGILQTRKLNRFLNTDYFVT